MRFYRTRINLSVCLRIWHTRLSDKNNSKSKLFLHRDRIRTILVSCRSNDGVAHTGSVEYSGRLKITILGKMLLNIGHDV